MSVVPEQTSMPVPGTSRPRSALCAPTSSASTAAATTRATATRTSCPWTTASRAFWGSAWNCPRTSKWTTTCGWSGRSSPNLFHGKNCYSEKPQLSVRSSDKDSVIADRRIIITQIIHILYSWRCSQMWTLDHCATAFLLSDELWRHFSPSHLLICIWKSLKFGSAHVLNQSWIQLFDLSASWFSRNLNNFAASLNRSSVRRALCFGVAPPIRHVANKIPRNFLYEEVISFELLWPEKDTLLFSSPFFC